MPQMFFMVFYGVIITQSFFIFKALTDQTFSLFTDHAMEESCPFTDFAKITLDCPLPRIDYRLGHETDAYCHLLAFSDHQDTSALKEHYQCVFP